MFLSKTKLTTYFIRTFKSYIILSKCTSPPHTYLNNKSELPKQDKNTGGYSVMQGNRKHKDSF